MSPPSGHLEHDLADMLARLHAGVGLGGDGSRTGIAEGGHTASLTQLDLVNPLVERFIGS